MHILSTVKPFKGQSAQELSCLISVSGDITEKVTINPASKNFLQKKIILVREQFLDKHCKEFHIIIMICK